MSLQAWDSNNAHNNALVPVDRSPSRDTDSWVEVIEKVVYLAENICNTEFVPKDFRNSVPKTTAAVLHGRELGLPPMTALSSVHVIQGRVGTYAETQRALIQAAGHELRTTEMTETRCVIKGRRRGEEEWATASYTMSEAERSGDARKNPNYQSRPADMLLARATGRLAKMHFADVIKGLSAVEELRDLAEEPETEVVQLQAPARSTEPPQAAEETTVGRRPQKARPKPAQKKEEPAAAPAPQRTRVARPAPKAAPASEPEEALVDAPEEPQPDEDGVIEAQLVEETDEEREARQMKGAVIKVMQHFERLQVTDREERLWYTGQILQKEVTTTKDLVLEDLNRIVSTLGLCKDLGKLDALLDAQREDGETK